MREVRRDMMTRRMNFRDILGIFGPEFWAKMLGIFFLCGITNIGL
jgi:hypothetical protein